jgi:hypothetical protein
VEAFLAVVAKLPIAGGAASLIVIAFIHAILSGRLVPRSALEDVRADRDARLAERQKESDDWRSAWEVTQTANGILAAQVSELLELSRTTNQFIQALPGHPRALEEKT